MPNALQTAGALAEPSNFAPLHTNRIFTGLWTNRSFLRDAATNDVQEHYGMGRQDSILDGLNTEITPRLTLARRPGSTVYNANVIAPVKRFYSFNTFTLTDEVIRVMADTPTEVLDVTAPGVASIWTKSAGAGSTYFLGVGNTLYFTNGVENKQWNYGSDTVWDWGIQAPPDAPTVSQMPRPSNYPRWSANTAYGINTPALTGMIILDDTSAINTGNFAILPLPSGGHLAIGCGQNLPNGQAIPLPGGDYSNTRLMAWATPGTGYTNQNIDGVYQSLANGGIVNSAFQNRSGGLAGQASSNWIAAAWDTAGAASVTHTTQAGFNILSFTTANGDALALVMGAAYHGSSVPVPAGFSAAEMLTVLGMATADAANHNMQWIFSCSLSGLVLNGTYSDQSGNSWHGNVNVFALFWKTGQGPSLQSVTNGNALVIPAVGTNTVALTFTPSLQSGASFGVPASANATVLTTASVTGGVRAGVSNGFGWGCAVTNQTITARYRDTSNNNYEWDAFATAFAVSYTLNATSGNLQYFPGNGTTGATEPSSWNATLNGPTPDGSVTWICLGPGAWHAGANHALGDVMLGIPVSPAGMPTQIYVCTTPGTSDAVNSPQWVGGPNLQVLDGSVVWTCAGRIFGWGDLGPSTPISAAVAILDPNNYVQGVTREGKSGATIPTTFATQLGDQTLDNTMLWTNTGGYSVGATDAAQYGYEYMNSVTDDLSNMSPASVSIVVTQGNHIIVQGVGSGDPQVDTIVIFKTAQGGSTFLMAGTVPNPGAGQVWTWVDDTTDDDLNTEWQAQVVGEGTPLPIGATALSYHLGRIVAAVGNVVYLSSGPDAVVGGSSGNAGFDTTFTVQSKIIRFWPIPQGLLVFTVRDTYILQGTGETGNELFMTVFSEDLPLKSYDGFTVNMTTAHLFLGNNMLVALDPGAGINEVGFPIADHLLFEYDPANSYLTYHKGSSLDCALYIADGFNHWHRMSNNNAPESGSAWSPRAVLPGGVGMGCVQSVEVLPGDFRLLISSTVPGPIFQRDFSARSDNGTPYAAWANFGAIVLAQPGQLAALDFFTLESAMVGTRPSLALRLGEASGPFEALQRTHQDPRPSPSKTVYSDRYHFAQNQQTAWCRYFDMRVEWAAEDVASELFTYTIFGQTWNEMRSQ